MTIYLNKDFKFIRVGLAISPTRIADVDFNVEAILKIIEKANEKGIQILAFPEMSITGYSIGDLIHQTALLTRAEEGMAKLLSCSAKYNMVIIVGMPISAEQRIFNCAVVCSGGNIYGVVPKILLPDYKEFYESRWFSTGQEAISNNIILCNRTVPFGHDVLFKIQSFPSAILGVEICEDMWVPLAQHEFQALAGATLLVNISASNEILGKADWRRTMIISESGRCIAGMLYVSSGFGESSNDIVYSGHAIIAENGIIHEESHLLENKDQLLISDIDLERLVHDRIIQTSFHSNKGERKSFRIVDVPLSDISVKNLYRKIDPHPFVPKNEEQRARRCREIFAMQVGALAQKLVGAKKDRIVLGVSGGLDSTLALLVASKTMDYMELPRTNIHAYTMPGFGTTNRTENNATVLCKALGVTFQRIDITQTCEKHLNDIRQSPEKEDIVFENVQARYRTELLFNIANQLNGIVLGTGDLTEIALGWATFAGDHISHYHINSSVPKTLVRYIIRWIADEEMANSPVAPILMDILNTPISPELRRPENGNITQKSEEIIGPVELADFFLYPFIRFGMRPGKILLLANEVNQRHLFEKYYSLEELYGWLKSFINRFFNNQFKRTCMPEGPKIGSVSLSPRGDWRMPSDAEARLWIEDLDSSYNALCKNCTK